ncbi:MAG: tetratricopeptide repeat protein, partial [Gammaproteobacteria bacterium]|nr:tetratricopeptide repeat protein [Gammaproteobacteria bacterium]
MSLLLDALKKAEKEKLKAREAEAAKADADAQKIVAPDSKKTSSPGPVSMADSEELPPNDFNDDLELVLNEDELEPVQAEPELEETVEAVETAKEPEKVSATTSTVSDDALRLLVYKTNKKYRQRQKAIWGGLLSATIVILAAAGSYYYYGMLEEVDALERKHKLAMRSVRNDSVVQQAIAEQKPAAVEKVQIEVAIPKQNKVVAKPPLQQVEVTRRDYSIKKSNAADPVSALLKNAWIAYNKSDYSVASRDYEKVLRQEPKNRDALLGVAAIAVKNSNYKKASASYELLLKLNPRDQLAMSAMVNINKLTSSVQDESQLKFMLQQQPSATHLNFALGNYYAKKSQWPEAQSEYFKAWQGDSQNADYTYNLAVSLDQIGKPKQALRFYKDSLLFANDKNISFSKDEV